MSRKARQVFQNKRVVIRVEFCPEVEEDDREPTAGFCKMTLIREISVEG